MYGTTREFLERFGLNDLSDLPKVEDLAEVLGFDPPILGDVIPAEQTLAFDFGDGLEGPPAESRAGREPDASAASVNGTGRADPLSDE